MKRFFTILATLAVASATITPASAQVKGEWSIKGGIGWYSLPDIVGVLIAGFGSIDTTEGTSSQAFAPLLNPNVEFHYGFNDWFALGGSLTTGLTSAKSTFEDSGATNKSVFALYPTLCVNAITTYFRSGKFSMYVSWGVGIMGLFSRQTGTDISDSSLQFGIVPMGNIYPLSFTYGGRTGGFAELGWGAKGFVNLGVYHVF